MTSPSCSASVKWILVTGIILSFALLDTTARAQDDRQWSSGKNLYEKVCAHCHNPDVRVGPEIGGRGLPEAYIKSIVRNGFNAMPAFPASHIDDNAIAELTEYLSSLPAATPQP